MGEKGREGDGGRGLQRGEGVTVYAMVVMGFRENLVAIWACFGACICSVSGIRHSLPWIG